MHSTWGTHAGSIAWFKNPQAQASAHYLVSRTGEIVQMVKDTDMGWHAGVYDAGKCPDWALTNPNWYCIGIEIEDNRDANWQYPEAQRKAVNWLVSEYLMKKYGIPKDRVLLHKNLNPSRRTDPVGAFSFDWVFGSGSNEQTITISTKVHDWLIGRASAIKDLALHIKNELGGSGFDDPDNTPLEKFKQFIAGIRSRVTDLTNKLAGAEEEVKNRTEQVGRLKDDLLARDKTISEYLDKLTKAQKDLATAETKHQGELAQKQLQVNAIAKDLGETRIKLAQAEAGQGFVQVLKIGKIVLYTRKGATK